MKGNELSGCAYGPAAGLRFRKVEASKLGFKPKLEQGYRRFNRFDERRDISAINKVCRIVSGGKGCDPQVQVTRDRVFKAAQCGARSGLIGVKSKDDPLREPAEKVQVLFTQCSTAGCDGHGHVCEMEGDDIGVTLDHHRLASGHNSAFGAVEPVEQPGLVVDRRFGRVQVLRAITVEQPSTESHGIPAEVAYRKHHPAPELIDETAAPAPRRQPGGEEHLLAQSVLF